MSRRVPRWSCGVVREVKTIHEPPESGEQETVTDSDLGDLGGARPVDVRVDGFRNETHPARPYRIYGIEEGIRNPVSGPPQPAAKQLNLANVFLVKCEGVRVPCYELF